MAGLATTGVYVSANGIAQHSCDFTGMNAEQIIAFIDGGNGDDNDHRTSSVRITNPRQAPAMNSFDGGNARTPTRLSRHSGHGNDSFIDSGTIRRRHVVALSAIRHLAAGKISVRPFDRGVSATALPI